MNIFYIPSWYPSYNNPIYGTFIKEQIELLARQHTRWHLATSVWGQGDAQHMLWAKDHFKNLKKIFSRRFQYQEHQANQHLYSTETLTWTRKLLHGNLNSLYKVNEKHFEKFLLTYGKLDVIHAQATYPAALIARHISRKYDVPYVVSIRMSPFPFAEFLNAQGKLKGLIKKPLAEATKLIATSHSLHKKLEAYGLKNAEVVHNPVDMDFFKPPNHRSLPKKELTLLSVGRLEPQKGIDLLIEAVALLGNRFPGKIRIGGGGSLRKDLEKLASDKRVADKFIWLGPLSRAQVRNEMQQCSFYVLPSRHETFGNVLLEAMACGKPVVATLCGGPEDIVTTETGILCENQNIEALSHSIDEMAKKINDFHSEAIQQWVVEKFSPNTFALKMKKLYQEVS